MLAPNKNRRSQHYPKQIVNAADYNVSPALFSPNAIQVVRRLQEAGFAAYIVGGGVRDALLGKEPKDFDVATDAKPEQMRDVFRNSRLIGRRFRLAHVFFGREIIEVATFRADHHKGSKGHGQVRGGMIIRDNVYGTLEEDAWRRDFTINALYYDPIHNTITDYTNGLVDLAANQLQIIGDATTRYREDPVRMLRAIRFASKLGIEIEAATLAPLNKQASLLKAIPPARLFEEMLKMFLTGYGLATFQGLQKQDFFQYLFPATDASLKQHTEFAKLVELALINSDKRFNAGKSVTPAFLLAIFLWQPLQDAIEMAKKNGFKGKNSLDHAASQILKDQSAHVAITKRFSEMMRDIWSGQYLLTRRHDKLAYEFVSQKRFRAAYDFLLLRAQAGEPITELAEWWTLFIDASEEQRVEMVALIPKPKMRSKRRRKPKAASSN